jgi:hypothetical protein
MAFLEDNNDEALAYKIREELEYLDERDSVKLTQLYDNLFATFLEENQAKQIKIEVEENYNGLKFGEKFEENDFHDMIRDFRQNRKIHAKYASKIIKETIKILETQPNIRDMHLNSNLNDECIVVVC